MNDQRNHSDPPTVDRLRADITAGVTGEKIGFPDPAAAPLGTDEEAAGTPPSREARLMEANARPAPIPPGPPPQGPAAFFFGLVALLALAIVVGAYMIV